MATAALAQRRRQLPCQEGGNSHPFVSCFPPCWHQHDVSYLRSLLGSQARCNSWWATNGSRDCQHVPWNPEIILRFRNPIAGQIEHLYETYCKSMQIMDPHSVVSCYSQVDASWSFWHSTKRVRCFMMIHFDIAFQIASCITNTFSMEKRVGLNMSEWIFGALLNRTIALGVVVLLCSRSTKYRWKIKDRRWLRWSATRQYWHHLLTSG